jgi:hypothetical protein
MLDIVCHESCEVDSMCVGRKTFSDMCTRCPSTAVLSEVRYGVGSCVLAGKYTNLMNR